MDLAYSDLKAKHREIREGFPEPVNLRIHRALSWLNRSEQAGDDDDAGFIFLWIAFNAAYAQELPDDAELRERALFGSYFERLASLDSSHRIFNVLWGRYPQEIRLLLANRYVYQPFWKYANGVAGNEAWERWFEQSTRAAANALAAQDMTKALSILFDRLYVLRNQLIHGGATWNSAVNREQVRDGRRILASLVPVFISVMMENPDVEWGAPYYPVVEQCITAVAF